LAALFVERPLVDVLAVRFLGDAVDGDGTGGAASSIAIRVAATSSAVRSCCAGCHSHAALRWPPRAE
jgi:hypothetical protein